MSGAIAIAEQHDAAGRHGDAVNVLAASARSGDYEAMTELGRRLLVGDRGPFLPRDGAGLVADAARGGSTEAMLRLAVLLALGAHIEQSWEGALQWLARAAELGSPAARGQLRVLTGRDFGSGTDEDWRSLAAAVDVASWTSPLPGVALREDPVVRRYPAVVPAPACAWLIEQARGRLRPALIYSGENRRDITDEMRTNSVGVSHLGCIDVVNVLVQYRIAALCGMPVGNLEGPTFLHYAVGEEITRHCDFINPRIPNYEREIAMRGERLITFLVYLNDDYDAGETDFPTIGVRHKGRCGDGLLFVNALPNGKPDTRMIHAGLPPSRGEKWVLSQFVRNRAVFNTPAENVA